MTNKSILDILHENNKKNTIEEVLGLSKIPKWGDDYSSTHSSIKNIISACYELNSNLKEVEDLVEQKIVSRLYESIQEITNEIDYIKDYNNNFEDHLNTYDDILLNYKDLFFYCCDNFLSIEEISDVINIDDRIKNIISKERYKKVLNNYKLTWIFNPNLIEE